MIHMSKSSSNSSTPQVSKDAKPVAPKRSLTPRRRAREYALQGVYQSLVVRRAGSLPNGVAIAKQLAEDPAFRRCQLELFQGIFDGVLERTDELEALITPALDRPINEAVELAKTFGGTDGHKYVNGVLDLLAKTLRTAETQAG